MVLKSIVGITSQSKYLVRAHFLKDGHFEDVEVDYLDKDKDRSSATILRRIALEKRKNKVQFITVNYVTGRLEIWVDILD